MSDKVRTRLRQELQKHNIDAYLAYKNTTSMPIWLIHRQTCFIRLDS